MCPQEPEEKRKNEGNSQEKLTLQHLEGYRFKITFPDAEKTSLIMDEPTPLGEMRGPNAAKVLAASVLNCLSASLMFCLEKSRVALKDLKAEAEPIIERNKEGYWRVTKINVWLHPKFDTNVDEARVRRCLDTFENYCVVTGAVRNGLFVDVNVNREN